MKRGVGERLTLHTFSLSGFPKGEEIDGLKPSPPWSAILHGVPDMILQERFRSGVGGTCTARSVSVTARAALSCNLAFFLQSNVLLRRQKCPPPPPQPEHTTVNPAAGITPMSRWAGATRVPHDHSAPTRACHPEV